MSGGRPKENRVRIVAHVDELTAQRIDFLVETTRMNNPAPKNPAAVALGRLGGRVKSAAKAAAVRENGKKGGRPKKQK